MSTFLRAVKVLKAERVFVVLALVFGALNIALTPPFLVPDEPNHFYRIWQISEGDLVSQKVDHRVGGELPSSLKRFVNLFIGIYWYGPDYKLDAIPLKDGAKMHVNAEDRTFIDFNNTALYTPICYLPAALAVKLLKAADLPLLYIFYLARLTNLICWLLLVFFSIRALPFCKWLMCSLALLPMSVFINSSLSADVMTNGLCFLFMGTVMGIAFGNGMVSKQKSMWLLILSIIVVCVKTIYTPLILLLVLIPRSKFPSQTYYKFWISSVILFCGMAFILSNHMINRLYITFSDYNSVYRSQAIIIEGADMRAQLQYIVSHKMYMVNLILTSLLAGAPLLLHSFIGALGWLEVWLPGWTIIISYTLLLYCCTFDQSQIVIPLRARILFISLFLFVLLLILITQHLIWDPVGGEIIQSLQGRYLTPFAFLLFITFQRNDRRSQVQIATIVISVFTLVIAAFLLRERYFN
jgi:uncharacterized membrane protein